MNFQKHSDIFIFEVFQDSESTTKLNDFKTNTILYVQDF